MSPKSRTVSSAWEPILQYQRAACESNGDPIPRRLALRLHSADCGQGRRFDALIREIEVSAKLFDRDREVVRLDWRDGENPDASALRLLWSALQRNFTFSSQARPVLKFHCAASLSSIECDWLYQQGFELDGSRREDAGAVAIHLLAPRVCAELALREGLDVVPLGPSAEGCVAGCALQNAPEWSSYLEAMDQGRLPVAKVSRCSATESGLGG